MQNLHFSIFINASAEKVWNTLWEDATYRQWTSVFSPGSHAISDWNEGSKILFLNPDRNGMSSIIAKSKPFEFMSFRHVANVKNGEEQPPDEAAKKWSGSTENYTLKENGKMTTLTVDIDAIEEFLDFFNTAFPKALTEVKKLSES